MILMKLFARKEWRCRCREWTCGCSGGGKGGQIEKAASACICILSGVRWIASEKLLCSAGSPFGCSVMTWRDGVEGEKGRVVCIIMADLSCMAETNTAL